MFFNSDAESEEFQEDEVETPSKEASPIYAQAGLDPLDELAFHVDDAMQTKAMLEEADALATQRPALQDRYIASLTEAGNKVTEALHLARQHQRETPLPTDDGRPISFADRVEAGRGDVSLI
jgi:hypothetical protein